MDIAATVLIVCTSFELRLFKPFVAAAQFAMHNALITVRCPELGQEITVVCAAEAVNCWGWRHFKGEWERRFGVIK